MKQDSDVTRRGVGKEEVKERDTTTALATSSERRGVGK
jgi:hypothetical protein